MQNPVDSLNTQFGINDILRFHRRTSGAIYAQIASPRCTARIDLLGATVTHFQPTGQQQPILFVSSQAVYQDGKAIRGGVPICFPWFGPAKHDTSAPAHGTVRTAMWTVDSTAHDDQTTRINLVHQAGNFELAYSVSCGDVLELQLRVKNFSQKQQRHEVALHSYFQVSDVEHIEIRGLESQPFLDQLHNECRAPTGQAITFSEETDRIYDGIASRIQLVDRGFQRTISIDPIHSSSTVVWNPWIDKSRRLSDFGDDEYQNMCCIETANIANRAIALGPQESHTTIVKIFAGSLHNDAQV